MLAWHNANRDKRFWLFLAGSGKIIFTMKRSIALVLILFIVVGTASVPVCARSHDPQNEQTISGPVAHQIPFGQLGAYRSEPEVMGVQQIQESVTELKPDLPKLDKSKIEQSQIKHEPLKGSVQHQEVVKNERQYGSLGNGQGSLDGSANRGQMRGNVNSGRSRDPNEIGLGIIGVKFATGFGRLPIVYEVFPGTPAAKAGMDVRDLIIAVDGIPTMGLTKDEIYNMIVGQPNTQVTISYRRKNNFQVCTLTRMDLNKLPDPMLRRDYLRW